MKRDPFAFKETQLFDWDTEPKQERPSEFQSTGFSTASGYHHSLGEACARPARRHRSGSVARLALALVFAIGVGSAGLVWVVHLVKG
jgi:hypothetical protein